MNGKTAKLVNRVATKYGVPSAPLKRHYQAKSGDERYEFKQILRKELARDR